MNLRAAALRADNLQRAAHCRRPLAHRAQSQVTRISSQWIKASAVVAHLQPEDVRLARQAYVQPVTLRVLDCVLQRFLTDSIQRFFGRERHIRFIAEVQLDLDAVAHANRRYLLRECGHQALHLK